MAIDTAQRDVVKTLPISIQGKPAHVSYDGELFWLNRTAAGAAAQGAAGKATATGAGLQHAYLCIPHALILHSSFIPDSDGGSLLLRLLAPPTNVERSALPPFKLIKSRARRVVELRDWLDAEDVKESTRRLAAQLSGPCSNLRLVKIEARVGDAGLSDDAGEWAAGLMTLAYPDVKPYRKMRVIVNPHGGPGKAVQLFQSRVRPILDAAGCTVDATITTHHLHGTEIAAALSLEDRYDAIVCVSGDGMLHEVLNGLAKRRDADQALQIPLVPIPAGSANAVALNLLGLDQGFNLALASLNAIKGKHMPVDVCCVTQPAHPADETSKASGKARRRPLVTRSSSMGKGRASALPAENVSVSSASEQAQPGGSSGEPTFEVGYSFLSQAIGLMADVDLGTEDLRMLGDTRFVLGFIGGVLSNKECEVDVYVKLGEKGTVDKADMRARVKAAEDEAAAADGHVRSTVEENAADHQDTNGANGQTQGSGPRQPVLRNGSVVDLLDDGEPDQLPALVPLDPSWSKSLLDSSSGVGSAGTPQPDLSKWYRVEAPISALYAGKIPYVSRDLLQFPFALPHDRCIDLSLMLHGGGRLAKLRGISSAETGAVVYDPAIVYLKCEAYRVVPRLAAGHKRLRKGGLVSIDGEHKPYLPFQVEVDDHVQMRFLSLFGQWQVPDVPPPKPAGA